MHTRKTVKIQHSYLVLTQGITIEKVEQLNFLGVTLDEYIN